MQATRFGSAVTWEFGNVVGGLVRLEGVFADEPIVGCAQPLRSLGLFIWYLWVTLWLVDPQRHIWYTGARG